MRVLFAGLFHETHSFLEETTGVDQFVWRRGDELLACEGDGSPLGGALSAARKLGWNLVPTIDCRAMPSGTATDEVFETFWSDLRPQVEQAIASGLDAIYLVLHGAMVTETCLDVEGELLRRLRAIAGCETLPIFGVFDLHANFSPAMAQYANCLVAYRENPHTDASDAAIRAAELLEQTLRSGNAYEVRTYSRHASVIWPPSNTGTANMPMSGLELIARHIEREDENILAVNVVGGFAYSDTPDTGVSFSIVTTDNAQKVEASLRMLCITAWRLRDDRISSDLALDEVMDRLTNDRVPGLTVLVEPSDNIGGGAPGDGSGLLRLLVSQNVQNAAVCICDPQAVAALALLEIGERITLPIGGKGSRLDEGPLSLEVGLVSRSDGRFALEDRQSHLASMFGDHFNMGPSAVVRSGGVTILLTSVKTPPFDLGQWRSQGLEPRDFAVIGVKAAVAHRRAYDPIAARMLWVDTPGPCRSDVRSFPYKHVRRPVFPLD